MSGRAAASVSVRARVPRGHDACRRLDLSCSVKIRSALSPCARQPRGSGPARASGVEDAAGGLQPGRVCGLRGRARRAGELGADEGLPVEGGGAGVEGLEVLVLGGVEVDAEHVLEQPRRLRLRTGPDA